jgi:RNA polymerase sigma-70 factor (ECF subfamily)
MTERAVAVPSFEEVYAAHAPFVIRNLRRLGVADAALDDAAQDVFVVVHRRLPEFEGRSAITTWLFAIVVGVARNQRRSRRRRAPESASEAEAEALAASPAERPDRRASVSQSVRLLTSLLDELDEDKREAFVLSQLEQMTAPEIAEALQLNVNTVYARIRASIQAFEQAVARHRAREAAAAPGRTA